MFFYVPVPEIIDLVNLCGLSRAGRHLLQITWLQVGNLLLKTLKTVVGGKPTDGKWSHGAYLQKFCASKSMFAWFCGWVCYSSAAPIQHLKGVGTVIFAFGSAAYAFMKMLLSKCKMLKVFKCRLLLLLLGIQETENHFNIYQLITPDWVNNFKLKVISRDARYWIKLKLISVC